MAIKKQRVVFNQGRHFITYTRDRWIAKATSELLDEDKEDQIREKIWNNIKRNPKNPRLAITEDFVNAIFDGFEGGTSPDFQNEEDLKTIFIWIQHSPTLRQWFNAIIHNESWDPDSEEINFVEDFDPDTFKLSADTLKRLAIEHKDLLKRYAPSVFSDRAKLLLAQESGFKALEDEFLDIFSCEAAHPEIDLNLETLEKLLKHKRHSLGLEMSIAKNPKWVDMLDECEWITEASHPFISAALQLRAVQRERNTKRLMEYISSDDFDEIQAFFIVQHLWHKVSPYAQLGIVRSLLHFISFGYLFAKAHNKAVEALTNHSVVFEAKVLQQSSTYQEEKDAEFNHFLISHIRDNHSEALHEKRNPLRSVFLGIADKQVKHETFDKSAHSQDDTSVFSETYIQSITRTYSNSQEDNSELLAGLMKKIKDRDDYFKDAENIQNDELLQIIRLSGQSGLSPDQLILVDKFNKACVENQLMLLRIIRLARNSKHALLYLRSLTVYVSALIKELPQLEDIFEPDDIRTLCRLRNKDIMQTVFDEKRLAGLVIQLASEFNLEKAAYITLFELFAFGKALHILTHPEAHRLFLHLHCSKVLFDNFDKTKSLVLNLWKKGFTLNTNSAQQAQLASSTESGENDEDNKGVNKEYTIQTLFSAIEWTNLFLLIQYAQDAKDTTIYQLSDDLKGPLITLIQRSVDEGLPANIFSFINPLWLTDIFESLSEENQYQLLSHMTSSDFNRFFDSELKVKNRSLLDNMMRNTDTFKEFLVYLSDSYSDKSNDSILLSLLTDQELKIPKLFADTVSQIVEQHSKRTEFKMALENHPVLNEMLESANEFSYSN